LEGGWCRGRRRKCTILNSKSSSFVISAMNHGICSRRLPRNYSHFPWESARCAGTPALALPAISNSFFVHCCWSSNFPDSSASACCGLALDAHLSRLALTASRDRKWTSKCPLFNIQTASPPSTQSCLLPVPRCFHYSSAWISATLSPFNKIWPVRACIVSL
jgi:hypothetical protein